MGHSHTLIPEKPSKKMSALPLMMYFRRERLFVWPALQAAKVTETWGVASIPIFSGNRQPEKWGEVAAYCRACRPQNSQFCNSSLKSNLTLEGMISIKHRWWWWYFGLRTRCDAAAKDNIMTQPKLRYATALAYRTHRNTAHNQNVCFPWFKGLQGIFMV